VRGLLRREVGWLVGWLIEWEAGGAAAEVLTEVPPAAREPMYLDPCQFGRGR
jgi:hypothetical protein